MGEFDAWQTDTLPRQSVRSVAPITPVSPVRHGPRLSAPTAPDARDAQGDVEISIVLPCLNEEEAIGGCVDTISDVIACKHLSAEILVVDNASTDRSAEIARAHGARVVFQPVRGYGNAYLKGFAEAHGKYIVMADADNTYDLSEVDDFVEPLRNGYDLVMGNRFAGRMAKGAMTWSHRYIGNPILSGILRTFFHTKIRDAHCGMRAFTKDAYRLMRLRTGGMEFASEMVIKSTLNGLMISEVPTTLDKDGRSRPPHLRSWRDGWRHLRFMLLFSPRWMFLWPGAVCFVLGLVAAFCLMRGPVWVAGVGLDIHSLLVAGCLALLGYQLLIFGLFTKMYAVAEGFHPPHKWLGRDAHVPLEAGVLAGIAAGVAGLALLVHAVWQWREVGLGALEPRVTMRQVIPAVVLMMLGVQTVFASFFLSILSLRKR